MVKRPKDLSSLNLYDWINSKDEDLVIIDVREQLELEIADFPHEVIHIPMSEISQEYISSKINLLKGKKVVVLCHMGVRSYNFGAFLLDNNYVDEVWNLKEGIDGWSRNIDSNIPRY